ncbi:MAG: glycerol-3-phosphate dehydrogenase, partial [Dehalococcoidia bacterium]|nr:glycerol-3-phosphate dehydrogenase [Dehalococcoidia bacterium]
MAEAKVAVIGTTSWGTTLAVLLSRKGLDVKLWARTHGEAQRIHQEGQNSARLPGVPFPPSLKTTASLDEALDGAALAILAVPSQRMRENVKAIRNHLSLNTLIMSAAKGLELDTGLRMSQVMAQELPEEHKGNI